jgi:hypothetical protein
MTLYENAVPRSMTPDDVVTNSGVTGRIEGLLRPLMAGMVSATKSGSVKKQIVRFAAERAPKTILENSASIEQQGQG